MEGSELIELLKADLSANNGNAKGLAVVVSYRIAHWALTQKASWVRIPVVLMHRLFTEVVLGVELPAGVEAGPGLQVWHCTGLVVHADSRLGDNVILRHNTTLGALGDDDRGSAPVLGDRVSVGTGAIIIGPIQVGDDATVGAGSVVVGDVPPGGTVVGNPARVIKVRET